MNYTHSYLHFKACTRILISLLLFLFSDAQAAEKSPENILRNWEKFEQYRPVDHAKALRYARLAVEKLDSTTISPQAAALYDFLADNSENHEFHYHQALEYKRHSARLYEALGHKRDIARTAADLGRLYLKEGDYHNAYTNGLRALHLAQSLRDTLSMREAYMTIEQVTYFYDQDVEQAMEYNRQVADTYHGRDQADQTVRALNNRFHYPLSPDEVREILIRGETICRKYGFNDMLLNIYLNVALQEILFGDLEASWEFLQKAKPLITNFKEEGYYYSASGFYHINSGNHQTAIEDTRRSIELLQQGDFDSKNVHSYFLLQELYQQQGNYREAYEALLQFSEIYTHQINTEDLLELSKTINDLELQRAREWHLFVIVTLVLGVILLIVGISLFYSRHKLEVKNRHLLAEKAEQELNSRNEIIKIQKLQQYQEQRNMTSLIEELSSAVSASDSKTMRMEINRIIQRLVKNPTAASDWVEVEKTMVSNKDIFFENLIKAYPNLTKNERKLCTFIHLNLSTKEISKMTHQSTGSINIARSRLRQKFGLTGSDQSLIAFLDQFKVSETGKE